MDILTYLISERNIYEPIVRAFIADTKERYGSLTPGFSQMLQLLEAYLVRGGKWHRPALAHLAYRITGGTHEAEVLPVFAALELLHRYLLIHDDIIDRDYERHDGPTIERCYQTYFKKTYADYMDNAFSKGMAIVAGDVVNSLAYELLLQSQIPAEILVASTHAFNQLMMETAAGWQTQTEQNFISLDKMAEADIIEGMKLVSAQYSVVWPLRIGQVLTSAINSNWNPQLESYGVNAGLAFQIMDDVLGMYGDPAQTGKPVGHDYREGKKTMLIYYAYSRATADDKAFISRTLGTPISDSDLAVVRRIIESTGALRDTQALAAQYAKQSQEALREISAADIGGVSLLAELADLFSNRTY